VHKYITDTTDVASVIHITENYTRQCHNLNLRVTISPDNVKFIDNSLTVCGTLSVTHIMPVLVLLSVVAVGIQQCMI